MMTVRDKLEMILARLTAREEDERVFTTLYPAAARAAADAADARRQAGVSLGPLDGSLISIKDLFDVAGEATVAGSVVLRDAAPAEQDAAIVRRLRQAGAVILGKTSMVEFAFSGLGLNPHFGTPGNATDPLRIPGGSSSGAGVAVAEGTSEISIGSDTGGSVRIPAALNGVVGFKPTAKRVPLDGAFPLSPSLDSIGPLARSVQDCAFADAVMAGEEPYRLQPYPLAGLRIGVPRGRLFTRSEAMVEEAFERTLSRLSKAGATIIDHSIDDLLVAMRETTAQSSIASIEAAEIHADWLTSRSDEIDPRVHYWLARSSAVPAHVYLRMMRCRRALLQDMDQRLAPIDVMALPTTAITAPLIAPLEADETLYNETDALILRNTQVANQFDLTAVSVPVPDCERPVGFMLMARHGDDRRLFSIAASVEQELLS
ncbi:amidase [Microvirga guangxiensis]|uniref:Indoleacetamide hydrolase n=1 Tax=Microvirga guangxiensis TaxID=549386 RepID=A0A1G5E374_9HYPH|nr:amidase [Microvirga guangxiensis]SCY21220.1 aspartyl-tRNA(Asn)/glutamyl-tRNA(Gln) amidotransferase subunit A [Microvirga guangxiensis]